MFGQFKFLGWSLVFMMATILTISFYFQEGMFFDGITYSALGRNLYLGYGSFWKPYYNEVFNPFYNHPPLVYWILSKFYLVFGDHMYVPKIYNLLVLLFTILIIRSLWLKMDEKNKSIDWWPFILWFSASVVFTTYRNTMLENTLSLFTLISIRLLWELASNQKKAIVLIGLSSIFIFLGFLTKGFVALFPLGFMVMYALCLKLSFRKMLIYSVLLVMGVGMCYYCMVTLNADSKPYFDYYYNQHVVKAVSGNEAVTSMGRYFLILQLLLELSPFIALSTIAVILNKRFGWKVNHKMVLMFFLIGISASFPLFISPKQRTYYLIPSIPYFILAFALITQPLVIHLVGKLKPKKGYNILSIAFIIIGISYCILFTQQKEKDSRLIADCRKLDKYFPDKTILETKPELASNWRVMAYLSRLGVITPSDKLKGKYTLLYKGEIPGSDVKEKIEIQLEMFDLYEKR